MTIENIETIILKKCGWNNKQLNFTGTMIHNIVGSIDEKPIADIVLNRSNDNISIEWFSHDQKNNKISLFYSIKDNMIIQEKTDIEINNNEDLNAFLDAIEKTVKNIKGSFFPKAKINLIIAPKIK